MNFQGLKAAALAAAVVALAPIADAAVLNFSIFDTEEGSENPPLEYGLRYDHGLPGAESLAFSFADDMVNPAILAVENGLGSGAGPIAASISGNVRANSGNVSTNTNINDDLGLWKLTYIFTGISFTDQANGYFTATGGSGILTEVGGPGVINLGYGLDNGGQAFYFGVQGSTGLTRFGNNPGKLAGAGWVHPKQGYSGANDFLFEASRTSSSSIPPIPLPAAAWMLIAALGSLVGFRKFRS